MKQLRFSNVVYGYAKILREGATAADMLCCDLNHILSLPMSVDGDFEFSVANEWRPPQDQPGAMHYLSDEPAWRA